MAQWPDNDPIIMSSAAQFSIQSDPKKRSEVFEASLREIKIMLYQVLSTHSSPQLTHTDINIHSDTSTQTDTNKFISYPTPTSRPYDIRDH